MYIKDLPPDRFKHLLAKTTDLIGEMYANIEDRPVYHGKSYSEIHQLFREDLPQRSTDIPTLFQEIKEEVLANLSLHYSPHFYAWVTSNATQASLIGEMLASAMNVNATTWMNAASASEMEQQVIRWIGQFINYDPVAKGMLLSGGSMANFTALKICLTQKAPYPIDKTGFNPQKPLIFYVSDQSHYSIEKAIRALGVGTDHLRKVKTNSDYTIDLQDLESQIQEDLWQRRIPVCIIGNAGTVNTGAVDDLFALSELAKTYNLWLHLDGAYGGFAAATDLRYILFEGLELADSISLDAHKWLFVPFECSCLLVKEEKYLTDSFSLIPAYQQFDHDDGRVDFSEYSLQQSRNFKALKVWMNFRAYGAAALKASIEKSITLMSFLSSLIDLAPDFELMAKSQLSVICFRYTPTAYTLTNEELNVLQKQIVSLTEERRTIFIRETVLGASCVLRICCTNFRREKEHLHYLLEEIREMGQSIMKHDRRNTYKKGRA